MSEGKILHLFDLRLDDDGNVKLVDGMEQVRRSILKRLGQRPPVVLTFPDVESTRREE